MTPELLRKRRTLAAQLAGSGFLLAAASAISFVFGAAGWGQPAAAAAVLITGVVAAPVLTVSALLVLAGPALGIGAVRAMVTLFLALVGFTMLALFTLSFGAGVDQADAGLPLDAFARSTWLFGLAAAAGLAAAVGLCQFAALRRSGRQPVPLAALASCAGGLAGALLIGYSLLSPFAAALCALAVLLVAALPLTGRGSSGRVSAVRRRDQPNLRRVRLLATASLAFTAVVWGGGLTASLANPDAATSALGTAAAAAQLAAVPLLLAATHLAASRLPDSRRLLWLGCAVAVVGIVAVAAVMVTAYSPDGDRFVRLIGALGLAGGAWAGAVAAAGNSGQPAGVRWVIAAVAVVAGAFVFALSAATGGIALLFVAALLAAGGRMRHPGISPATPRASS